MLDFDVMISCPNKGSCQSNMGEETVTSRVLKCEFFFIKKGFLMKIWLDPKCERERVRISSRIHLRSQFSSTASQKINFGRDSLLDQLKPPPFHKQKDNSLDFSDKELTIVPSKAPRKASVWFSTRFSFSVSKQPPSDEKSSKVRTLLSSVVALLCFVLS